MLTICVRSLFSRFSASTAFKVIPYIMCVALLSACGGVKTEAEYPSTREDARFKKYGTIGQISGDDSTFTLFDSSKRKNAGSAMGVNAYLWRGALDTINFMPIMSADSNGGTILTDWYSPPATPDERIKLNIVIKDQTLRADGVAVRVFKQVMDKKGNWRDAEVGKQTATQLEDTIVARARQLRLQSEGKKAE